MTRWARVGRGASAAVFATLIAAVSHMLAGGNSPTVLALVTTVVLALPLGVALAGVRLSLVRLALGVTVIQALFHTCFSLIGVSATLQVTGAAPLPAHAHHQRLMTALSSGGGAPIDSSASIIPSIGMLLWHAMAAVLTIALLRGGERSLHALSALVWTALTWLWQLRTAQVLSLSPRPFLFPFSSLPVRVTGRSQLVTPVRGPPTVAFASAPRLLA